MSETAPKLEHAEILPDSESELPSPPTPESETPDASQEDTKAPETEAACVVVKEDLTPKGRRMADEAREVAAAHASLLVDIEACKRVSMSRRLPLSLCVLCCLCMSGTGILLLQFDQFNSNSTLVTIACVTPHV